MSHYLPLSPENNGNLYNKTKTKHHAINILDGERRRGFNLNVRINNCIS